MVILDINSKIFMIYMIIEVHKNIYVFKKKKSKLK